MPILLCCICFVCGFHTLMALCKGSLVKQGTAVCYSVLVQNHIKAAPLSQPLSLGAAQEWPGSEREWELLYSRYTFLVAW